MPKQMYKEYDKKLIETANDILNDICLSDVAGSLAGEISYGQQKLLTIGYCMANKPDLMLLDEPVAGIDAQNFINIMALILKLKAEGNTILQIEHNQKYIEPVSDVILSLEAGKIFKYENYLDFTKNSEKL